MRSATPNLAADMQQEAAAYSAAVKRRLEAQCARRRKAHTKAEPIVRVVTGDGNTLAVSLCGTRGRDREMLIDRFAWADVSRRFGTRYVIEPLGNAVGGVCICVEGTDPVVPLAKYLVDLEPREFILQRNRNVLDLRRENFVAISNTTFMGIDNPFSRLRARPKLAASL